MTNEEKYLAKIAGENVETPEPVLRKEQYLNYIANESGEIPELPVTREERYLAILAGQEYETPAPELRIEQYMAKACGLEIEVPTPITRIEQLWAKIAEGGSWTVTEITGTLPLMFLSKGDDLIDYHIYGTSAGAGVETENLFDKNAKDTENGYVATFYLTQDNTILSNSSFIISEYIPVEPNSDYYLSSIVTYGTSTGLCFYDENKAYIEGVRLFAGGIVTTNITTPNNCSYIRTTVQISQSVAKKAMITKGSTPPPTYIPHGYKLPLTVESGETENLWDEEYNDILTTAGVTYKPIYVGEGAFTLSTTAPRTTNSAANIFLLAGSVSSGASTSQNGVWNNQSRTMTAIDGYVTIGYRAYESVDPRNYKTMLNTGSTALPYIPHRYETNYNLYIGDSKLMADEYVDYGEQKMYKRTEQLFDYKTMSDGLQGFYLTADGNENQSPDWAITDYIPCEGSKFVLSKVGGRIPAMCGYNAQKEFVDGKDYNTSGAGVKRDIYATFNAEVKFIRFSYYITDPTPTITVPKDDVATLTLIPGSTAPSSHIPYLQPTDPPVPLPPIPTFKDENTLSSTETLGEVTVKGRIKEAVPNG